MKKVLFLNKKEGYTPLEALEKFRRKHKGYKNVKMTYAGRLDPMASGLLLVLAGDETKNKEKYLGLDKEYDFEILFGFATDTYDILGKVLHYDIINNVIMLHSREKLEKKIEGSLKHFTGVFMQKYPLYSSKAVGGRQLFEYGRSGEEVELPSRKVSVRQIKFLKLRKVNNLKLLANIEKRIMKVKGDFRQKEILEIWRKKLGSKKPQSFYVGSFSIKCGSGTYVRGIANSLGERIGMPALAFSIQRTKLGKWSKST